MYHVSVLAYDGVFASALTGVMDLLNLTGVTWNRIHGEPLNRQFKVQMVSRGGEPVRCTAGMRIAVDTALERVDQCDLVVVPTIGNEITQVLHAERDTLEWLRFLHAGGADLASNCTGSFLLAEAGLLDGRRATTHWGYSQLFRERYPRVNLDERELITRDGNIFCAGGGTAWRDLTILLVERFCGADMARELAMAFVIDVRNDPQSVYAGLPAQCVAPVRIWSRDRAAPWIKNSTATARVPSSPSHSAAVPCAGRSDAAAMAARSTRVNGSGRRRIRARPVRATPVSAWCGSLWRRPRRRLVPGCRAVRRGRHGRVRVVPHRARCVRWFRLPPR